MCACRPKRRWQLGDVVGETSSPEHTRAQHWGLNEEVAPLLLSPDTDASADGFSQNLIDPFSGSWRGRVRVDLKLWTVCLMPAITLITLITPSPAFFLDVGHATLHHRLCIQERRPRTSARRWSVSRLIPRARQVSCRLR